MIWKNIKLRNELRKLTKDILDLEDILVFGSIVRGKVKPNDLDILIIFKNKVDKVLEYKIRKLLERHYNSISIISKTKKDLINPAFDARESVLLEGISLLSGKPLNENYGLVSLGLFKYNFKNWNSLQKTKFYYALNGRFSEKGILQKLNCIKLADGLILTPIDKIEEVKEFLESWNLEYRFIPIMIPQRLNRKNLLE